MSKILNRFSDDHQTEVLSDYHLSGTKNIPDSLVITVDASHAGYKNKNGFWYDVDAMRHAVSKDAWTKPFPKPFLKNHDLDSEPIGRVQAARFVDTVDGKGFTQLDIKVTDSDAIEKIMDGRYLTVSTHGAPMEDAASRHSFVVCSICKTDMLVDDYCGHSRGHVYEDDDGIDRLCFWKVGALDYKEVSIVNNPADNDGTTAAQITEIAMVDGEEPVSIDKGDSKPQSNLMIFADSDVMYADSAFLEAKDPEKLVANAKLWESVGKDVQKYVDNKGLIYDSSDAFYSVPTWENDKVYLSSKEKGGLPLDHQHTVMYEDELGNGYTDYVNGHGHSVIDGKLSNAVIPGTDTLHSHTINDKEVDYKYDKMILDSGDGHRHGVYINAAGNGSSSWVKGHSHDVVGKKVMKALTQDAEKGHVHKLVEWNENDLADIAGSFSSIKDVKHFLSKLDALDELNKEQKELKTYFETVIEDSIKSEKECFQLESKLLLQSLELFEGDNDNNESEKTDEFEGENFIVKTIEQFA